MFLKSVFAEHPFRYRVFQGLDNLTHQFSLMVHDITLLSFGYQNNNLLNIWQPDLNCRKIIGLNVSSDNKEIES